MPTQRTQVPNLAYWAAVAALFTWGAWLRLQAPLDPIADQDVWGYLSPAVSKLIGAGFTHSGRNFVYPGFLYLLLRVAGDFRVITITQHLLGLIAGGVLLLTWRRLQVFVPSSRVARLLHGWLGLMGAAFFLAAGEPIRAEIQL